MKGIYQVSTALAIIVGAIAIVGVYNYSLTNPVDTATSTVDVATSTQE